MPSLAYNCRGCGLNIDADDAAVMLRKDVAVRAGGSIDPTGWEPDEKVTHKGHEGPWTGAGIPRRGQGTAARDCPLTSWV